MVISRKTNLLVFLVIISLIAFSPVSLAGVTFWDIQANQIFFRGSGNGQINLNNDGTADQIQIINGVVEFDNFSVGPGRISFLGFNASDNTNVSVLIVNQEMVTFNIDANNGVNTTTVIKAPPGTLYVDVDGEDSFTFDPATELVNIYEVHGMITKQITVFFTARGSRWGLLSFFLILICIPIALVLVKGSRR